MKQDRYPKLEPQQSFIQKLQMNNTFNIFYIQISLFFIQILTISIIAFLILTGDNLKEDEKDKCIQYTTLFKIVLILNILSTLLNGILLFI